MTALPAAADRALVRKGFLLVALAFLGGTLVPLMANMRMGLGAHVIGLFGGLLLIAIGLSAPLFRLSGSARRLMNAFWITATYGNWISAMLAGWTGASRLTPIAGAGTTGSPLAETVVFWLFALVGVTSLAAAGLSVAGLRPLPDRQTDQ